MNITRRSFFGSAAALGVVATGCSAFKVPTGAVIGDPKKLRLRFGMLSDVHLNKEHVESPLTSPMYHTLCWFRDQKVDAVAFAGDITDNGTEAQARCFQIIWDAVFPDNKRPDGGEVVCVPATGNHDIWGGKPEVLGKYIMRGEHVNHFVKTVKGYSFLCTNWPGHGTADKFINETAPKLPADKPFFYIQHQHPRNTCYGSWAWGADSGNSTAALSKFPNAIAFSGHSHYTLTDERSIWQGSFTSIGTSSLSYSSVDYDYRINQGSAFPAPRDAKGRRRTMPCIKTSTGKQGMLLSVFDDHIRIVRRDFVANASLGDDWVIPLGKHAPRPYNFKDHKARRTAPEFPAGAGEAVTIKTLHFEADVEALKKKVAEELKNKTAEEVADAQQQQLKKLKPSKVRIEFPSAEARNGCQVFEYQVTAIFLDHDLNLPFLSRLVMAPEYFYGPDTKRTPGVCELAIADLPPCVRIQFEITPIECFGKKGRPILSPVWRTPC